MKKDGWCVWVTGLPGSGKSVIVEALIRRLKKQNVHAQVVSVDMLRRVITPKPTYSETERDVVYASISFVAKLLTQNGVNVIIDATGNRRRYRDNVRKMIPKFIEAYVRCPIETCMERENERRKTFMAPKEIYKRGLSGEAPTVPGLGVPYEESLHPEITVDSDRMSQEECAQEIQNALTRWLERL